MTTGAFNTAITTVGGAYALKESVKAMGMGDPVSGQIGTNKRNPATVQLGRLKSGDMIALSPDGPHYTIIGARGRQVVLRDAHGSIQTISALTPVFPQARMRPHHRPRNPLRASMRRR